MEDRVKTIICDVLGLELAAIHDDISMTTVEEWDSLRHMELIASLEQSFNIRLTLDQIVAMTTLPSIVSIIRSHGA